MSARRRVAIIGTRGYPSYYGGFETLLRHLVPYLSECGWDVDVYCRDGVDQLDPDDVGSRSGTGQIRQVFTKGFESKSASTLSFGLTSAVHAARTKPDVALVMNVANGFWLPILRARGIPTAVNVDGIEWDREKWNGVAKKVFLAGAHMTARTADQLVFDANAIGRRWESQFGRLGTFIPYGGTSPVELSPDQQFEPGSYVLYVARFVPENSTESFIEAAKQISTSSQIVIVGSSGYGGPLEDKVRAAAANSDNISWLGHVNNDQQLHSLWANAGVYFHGHSVGGTNPALVQAMACGAPVVARETPYNREVLGNAAVYTQPDPDEIAMQLMRVLGDDRLRADISSAARARQRQNYTWEIVCDRYEQVLQHLRSAEAPQFYDGASDTSPTNYETG